MEDMQKVYQQHAQTVYKFLLAQCRDPGLAEELTQETFYQAVRSVDLSLIHISEPTRPY